IARALASNSNSFLLRSSDPSDSRGFFHFVHVKSRLHTTPLNLTSSRLTTSSTYAPSISALPPTQAPASPRSGMDISPDWAASALFSPSKARQQAAQAKDWAYVDGWLAAKYAPKPAPAFERNSDTLTALLALAAGNEEADERREMVERVEEEALREAREVVGAYSCGGEGDA
ncbi:hypothetical protein LTR16_002090, partial [Cryomyces antarcticus]